MRLTDPEPQESTELLVRLAQEGDRTAFAKLVDRHERVALAVAYAIVRDAASASDVVQEAFLKVWKKVGDLQDPARFQPWLCTTVRNLAHDWIRSQPRRATALDEGQQVQAESARDGVVEAETRGRVALALDGLDELSRTAVVMRYYHGFSSREIGKLLELSPAAVDMRLSRARQTLRSVLSDLDPLVAG